MAGIVSIAAIQGRLDEVGGRLDQVDRRLELIIQTLATHNIEVGQVQFTAASQEGDGSLVAVPTDGHANQPVPTPAAAETPTISVPAAKAQPSRPAE